MLIAVHAGLITSVTDLEALLKR